MAATYASQPDQRALTNLGTLAKLAPTAAQNVLRDSVLPAIFTADDGATWHSFRQTSLCCRHLAMDWAKEAITKQGRARQEAVKLAPSPRRHSTSVALRATAAEAAQAKFLLQRIMPPDFAELGRAHVLQRRFGDASRIYARALDIDDQDSACRYGAAICTAFLQRDPRGLLGQNWFAEQFWHPDGWPRSTWRAAAGLCLDLALVMKDRASMFSFIARGSVFAEALPSAMAANLWINNGGRELEIALARFLPWEPANVRKRLRLFVDGADRLMLWHHEVSIPQRLIFVTTWLRRCWSEMLHTGHLLRGGTLHAAARSQACQAFGNHCFALADYSMAALFYTHGDELQRDNAAFLRQRIECYQHLGQSQLERHTRRDALHRFPLDFQFGSREAIESLLIQDADDAFLRCELIFAQVRHQDDAEALSELPFLLDLLHLPAAFGRQAASTPGRAYFWYLLALYGRLLLRSGQADLAAERFVAKCKRRWIFRTYRGTAKNSAGWYLPSARQRDHLRRFALGSFFFYNTPNAAREAVIIFSANYEENRPIYERFDVCSGWQ